MIKIDIVESRPIYLRGLVTVLTRAGVTVLSARTALDGPRPWRSDAFVLDSDADTPPVLAAAVASISIATPVLILGSDPENTPVTHLRAAGASGFINRDAHPDDLLDAIHAATRGGAGPRPVHDDAGRCVGHVGSEVDGTALSPREQQVLRQIARGRTHGQIARTLGISHHTVDTYVKRIRSKLTLGNKAELTRAAVLGDVLRTAPPEQDEPPVADSRDMFATGDGPTVSTMTGGT